MSRNSEAPAPRTGQGAERRGTAGSSAQSQETPARAERPATQTNQAAQPHRQRSNQATDRNSDRRDVRDRDRSRMSRDRDEDRARDRTTGQYREDRKIDRQDRASDQRRSNEAERVDRDRRNLAADRQDSRRGSISLSAEQRTRVSTRFAARIDSMHVQPLPRSRLSVSVGVIVPSAITLYEVPADVIAVYPGFRGYKFVVVEDHIVIIEPRSRRIVTTLAYSGGERPVARERGPSTTGMATRGRIRLSPEERTVIRETVLAEPTCRYEQRLEFFLVIPLPTTVRVCDFPARVVSEVPGIRSYRYVTRGDEVLVVDPEENRVIEVID